MCVCLSVCVCVCVWCVSVCLCQLSGEAVSDDHKPDQAVLGVSGALQSQPVPLPAVRSGRAAAGLRQVTFTPPLLVSDVGVTGEA